MMMIQKGRSNRPKIEYVVGVCMYIDEKASILCVTKLLWVQSILKPEKIFGSNLLKLT